MRIISILISIALMLLGKGLSYARPTTNPGTGNPATAARRNAARRNDVERVLSGVMQYQTNNNGRTPMQQSPMLEGDQFIQNYLVGVYGNLDDFADPDGTRYKIEFSNFDTTKKYGLIDKMDYTIYVVGKAACNGETIIESEKARDYAVSYKLENDTYCIDSQ